MPEGSEVVAGSFLVGASFLVLALVWMMVQAARASTAWKRRLCWLLFLVPFLLAGMTALLIYAERDESGFAFLATPASVVVLILVALLVSLRGWPRSRRPLLGGRSRWGIPL
jgi:cytochrome bd-type quinol oxidase subunit 2